MTDEVQHLHIPCITIIPLPNAGPPWNEEYNGMARAREIRTDR
jgi:hypothetical protein